jgi:hypothetical protein
MSIWTWNFDMPTNTWQQKEPHNGAQQISAPGANADYDPNTGMVFLSDNAYLYSYNVNTNTYTQLVWVGTDYHLNGVIDPGRKFYFIIGGGQFWAVNIAGPTYTTQDWSTQVSGCSALDGAGYPGLAYDSVQKLIVGWVGGNSVITFNPDTKTCSTVVPLLPIAGSICAGERLAAERLHTALDGRWRNRRNFRTEHQRNRRGVYQHYRRDGLLDDGRASHNASRIRVDHSIRDVDDAERYPGDQPFAGAHRAHGRNALSLPCALEKFGWNRNHQRGCGVFDTSPTLRRRRCP